ncbi:MAG: M23 family metallopeptidase [Desulfobacteraceae bacterium]|nr:M23 family metallopeptidase [Desulfobacteraceae bacterium]
MINLSVRFSSFCGTLISLLFLLSANGHATVAGTRNSVTIGSETATAGELQSTAPSLTVINGKIGKNPVYTELVSLGLTPAEVISLSKSFKKVFDLRRARPNDEYRLILTSTNQLHEFTYKTDVLNQYVAQKTDDGGFDIYKQDIILEKELAAKEFVLENSLYQAILNAGENANLVSAFVDIFSWDIDFYLYPRKGDRIVILFERYLKDGQFVKYGDILVARYIGKNGTHSAFLFDDGNVPAYYDEQGHLLRKMFLRVPVKFGVKTSSYSIRRFHPISKKYKRHTGIDYGAVLGTPVLATAGGKVKFSGWKGGYGKLVILRHANGYETYYGHCNKLLVANGQFVKQGQTIAKVGRTGTATGTHVHYEIRSNGKPINPNSIKTMKGNPLQAKLLDKYHATVQSRLMLVETLTARVEKSKLVSANP